MKRGLSMKAVNRWRQDLLSEQNGEFQTLPEMENVNWAENQKDKFLSDLQSRAVAYGEGGSGNSERTEKFVIDISSDDEDQTKPSKLSNSVALKRKAEETSNPGKKQKGTPTERRSIEREDISMLTQKSTTYVELTSSGSDEDSFSSHSSSSSPGRDSNGIFIHRNQEEPPGGSRTNATSRSRSRSSSSNSRSSSTSSTYHDDVSAHSVSIYNLMFFKNYEKNKKKSFRKTNELGTIGFNLVICSTS